MTPWVTLFATIGFLLLMVPSTPQSDEPSSTGIGDNGMIEPSVLPQTRKPKTWFVATTGDDSADGSADRPFATIQKAVDMAVRTDTVTIRGGIYNQTVALTNSGSYFGREIKIAAAEGEKVILDGANQSISGAVFSTSGQDHLTIRGLEIRNARSVGILIQGSWQVTLEDCIARNCGASGIIVDKGHDVKVRNCEVERACQTGGEESISVKRSTDVLVEKCHVHHTGHEGIDVKEGSKHVIVRNCYVHHTQAQGLYADAWDSPTYDIRFENNHVHDCMSGANASTESGGFLSDVWFVNNLIYDCRGPGIIVTKWGDEKRTHGMKNIYILNNTVVNCGHGFDHPTWGGGILMENDQAENIVIMNNVLSQNPDGQLRITMKLPPISYTSSNNLLDGVTENLGTGNILAPALFIDPVKKNFRLSDRSKAINAGKSTTGLATVDLDGKPRITGKKIDLGAYEHQK